jgi:hypothetical protein
MTSQVVAAPNGVDCAITWDDAPGAASRVKWAPLSGAAALTGIQAAAAPFGTLYVSSSENWGEVAGVADRAGCVAAIATAIGTP